MTLISLSVSLSWSGFAQDCSRIVAIKSDIEATKTSLDKPKKVQKRLNALNRELEDVVEAVCSDLSYQEYKLYKDDKSICKECDDYHKNKVGRNALSFYAKYLQENKSAKPTQQAEQAEADGCEAKAEKARASWKNIDKKDLIDLTDFIDTYCSSDCARLRGRCEEAQKRKRYAKTLGIDVEDLNAAGWWPQDPEGNETQYYYFKVSGEGTVRGSEDDAKKRKHRNV